MSPYYYLANAIIEQAVKDYRLALKRYKLDPEKEKNANEVAELECFFTSAWFEQLSDLNGKSIMEMVREMIKTEVAA